jgi:hypothetical protein
MRGLRIVSISVLVLLGSLGEHARGEPRLTLTNQQGQIALLWPAAAANFVLERATHLRPPVPWVRVSRAECEEQGEIWRHRLAFTGASRFFRLREARSNAVPALPAGLLAAWRLDEGAGTLALPNTSLEIPLLLADAGWTAGRIGPGALAFNGGLAGAGGSRASLSNTDHQLVPPPGRPFSVSVWFSPDALDTAERLLLGMDAGESGGWGVSLRSPGPTTNELVLTADGAVTAWPLVGETPLLLPGLWHQLTLTADGAATCLFVDGARVGCVPGAVAGSTGSLWLGGGLANRDSFLGRLDDLRVYTNALTAEQVALTGEWLFDEASGEEAADSSVLGHPATGLTAGAWAEGKRGGALALRAGPVTINNADADVLPVDGAPFSLSCWLRPQSFEPGRAVVLGCAGDPLGGWQLAVETAPDGQPWLRLTATHGGTLDLAAPVALPLEVWTKVDIAFSGGIATLYVNGVHVTAQPGAIRGSRAPLMLGAETAGETFDGLLDELRLYRRERRAAEIGPVASNVWETVLVNTATNLTLAGDGPADKPLTYLISPSSQTIFGSFEHPAGGRAVSYIAGTNKGRDSFSYRVSDGEFTSPPATVTISVVQPHWLSPAGGTEPPLDGSSSARAWVAGPAEALDAIWRTNKHYDAFFYAPGEYETTGYKYLERATANPGCKHYGAGAEGPDTTTIRLVNSWEAWREGIIFADLTLSQLTDGFELHHLRLDCNGANNPKLLQGEPVWLRLPLTSTARVDTVTLHWSGPAAEYSLCTRTPADGLWITNCLARTNTGWAEVVPVDVVTDEIVLRLERRAPGISLYGLREIEVAGAALSMPTATTPEGEPSRLDAGRGVVAAVDGSTNTVWASGAEALAQLTFPFAAGAAVDRLTLHWNCQTLPGIGWLGPAAEFLVLVRNDATRQFDPVPITRHGRATNGVEIVTFGLPGTTNAVVTTQLALLLTAREPGVSFYSLREVSFHQGGGTVAPRLPTALNQLDASRSVLRAVDGDPGTQWISGTQGGLTAVHVRGSQIKLTNLKIVGFGTTALRECFPIMFYVQRYSSPVTDVLIQDCEITEPAGWSADGVTGVVLVGDGAAQLRNAVVRRCTVRGLRSRFTYSHAFSATLVEDCQVEDCGAGVYFEPNAGGLQSVGPVVVRRNQFKNVAQGIYLLMLPGAAFDSILAHDNQVLLTPGVANAWGFNACDTCAAGPSGTITNVVLLHNRIHYPDWQPRPAGGEGGLHYSDIQHAVFGRNLITLGNANGLRVRAYPSGRIPPVLLEDCDHPYTGPPGTNSYAPSLDVLPPGYRRAWFENRDLSGQLLPVRHRQSNQDRLAAQQQWP